MIPRSFFEFLEANKIPYRVLAPEVYEKIKVWQEEINVMENWFEFEFHPPYMGREITSINDVPLPEQYLNFMRKHNGGGELYGLNSNGNYFNVPVLIEEDCISYLGYDIEKLPKRVNELWME